MNWKICGRKRGNRIMGAVCRQTEENHENVRILCVPLRSERATFRMWNKSLTPPPSSITVWASGGPECALDGRKDSCGIRRSCRYIESFAVLTSSVLFGFIFWASWSGVSAFFVGAFAKLRKATRGFVMSVCPFIRLSVCVEKLDSHWKNFCEIWYFSIFRKSVKKFEVWFKMWQE
jgi:hypothetical protein